MWTPPSNWEILSICSQKLMIIVWFMLNKISSYWLQMRKVYREIQNIWLFIEIENFDEHTSIRRTEGCSVLQFIEWREEELPKKFMNRFLKVLLEYSEHTPSCSRGTFSRCSPPFRLINCQILDLVGWFSEKIVSFFRKMASIP